uniref:Uncharacterized protein n=1 Tax=Neolamprologus brichardi TaxID=32507 RepID=A0A3Q4G9M8_NEOBR
MTSSRKMASLRTELWLRDGQRQTVSVQVETHLSSLIRGISELNQNLSQLLSELVEREKLCAQGELQKTTCEQPCMLAETTTVGKHANECPNHRISGLAKFLNPW